MGIELFRIRLICATGSNACFSRIVWRAGSRRGTGFIVLLRASFLTSRPRLFSRKILSSAILLGCRFLPIITRITSHASLNSI
jgi:hypothetical protein